MSGGPEPDLSGRLAAEAVGSALPLATVVGSGIMGERLAGRNLAVALLGNSLATGAALVALILTFGPISGAHFNPAVTLAMRRRGSCRGERCQAMSRSRSPAPSSAESESPCRSG